MVRVSWVSATDLPTAASHTFYRRLNQLAAHDFHDFVEQQCAPFYAKTMGWPGLAPDIYFRLLLIAHVDPDAALTPLSSDCDHISLEISLFLSGP